MPLAHKLHTLCSISRWIESVLEVTLPSAVEFESALQNGVILCRLGMKLLPDDPMWSKVYDLDESKFKVSWRYVNCMV